MPIPSYQSRSSEVQFTDTVFVDNGIQQLGTCFIYSKFAAYYNYDLFIQTTVPCFSYVMIMVEMTGVAFDASGGFAGGLEVAIGDADPRIIKQSWNFYTYSYDIGNINTTNGNLGRPIQGFNLYYPYCWDGVNEAMGANVEQKTKLGLVIDVYAVAGNGARYPVEIVNAYLSPQV